jgi:hypothetical protein
MNDDLWRMEHLAQNLALRVHDEDPEENGAWWDGLTPREQRAVAFILAAAMPVDRPWSELIAWTDPEGIQEKRRRQWRESKKRAITRGVAA